MDDNVVAVKLNFKLSLYTALCCKWNALERVVTLSFLQMILA
jgi:hypothetical protein